MVIGIFSYAEDLSGGNYRLAKTMPLFPSSEFMLMMPKDRLEAFKKKAETLYDKRLMEILEGAVILPPLNGYRGPVGILKYGSLIAAEAKKHGIEFLYFPYGNQYFSLAFRLAGIKWTQLLQQSPVVGSLIDEDGNGFGLLMRNLKLNLGYSNAKVIKGYFRLLLLSFATKGIPLLSVSESIKYEMEKIGIKLNVNVINPGNGVDPCNGNLNRDIDLVFYARLIPEKGVYDFLKLVQKLNPDSAVIAGFASKYMENWLKNFLIQHDLNHKVKLMVNLTHDEGMQLLMRSKVFVYPTRLDSFALVVLEALSCGTAVISYSIPAIRMNYMTDAVAKVRPMDLEALIAKTKEVLKNDLWAEMGKNGRIYASYYTWEKVASSEWSTLQSILNSS
ncbi:MAG: glycosyltransferase family 4 protein [Nitrososphaeria archaeon]